MGGINQGSGYTYEKSLNGVSLDILPQASGSNNHPFKVILVKDGTTWKFKVVPGTVNSKVPTLDGTLLDAATPPTKSLGSASGYVYLDLEYEEGLGFPKTALVKYETTVPADTDTKSHVALAYVDFTGSIPKKTAQYVSTSLWGERLKCGSSTAEYYFSRA
jgi:hypothetical protein